MSSWAHGPMGPWAHATMQTCSERARKHPGEKVSPGLKTHLELQGSSSFRECTRRELLGTSESRVMAHPQAHGPWSLGSIRKHVRKPRACPRPCYIQHLDMEVRSTPPPLAPIGYPHGMDGYPGRIFIQFWKAWGCAGPFLFSFVQDKTE